MKTPLLSPQAAHWRAQAAMQWQALPPRQRVLAAIAGGLLAGALVWWLALSPALATLRTAPAQHQALDAQLQRMRALQAQARSLKALPRITRDEALRLLDASVRQQLGAGARLAPTGDTATLTVAGTSGDALANWLAQARVDARIQPAQVRLTRNPAGLWEGTLVLPLPAQ